jgi:Outer membrane protein beta-barrel domain
MATQQFFHQFSKLMSGPNAVQWLICGAMCLFVPIAFAQTAELATKSENTVGLTLASYKYDEPSYMTLKANKVGIDFSGTYAFGSQWPNPQQSWFVKGEFQTLSGKADYQSPFSGAISNTPNRSVEVRALVGKDFEVGGAVFAPYVGLGYRHLYSNIGYERTSTYNTLPIGVTHKMSTSGLTQLHTTVEYMHLLSGVHKVNLLSQNVSLDQRRGYGLRLSMMHRQEAWSMGPTLTYWNMPQSEVAGVLPVYEPQNKTLELGFKGAYRF